MGLELIHVLSKDERHYGPFLCAICCNLCALNCVVTTSCSHAFCKPCLQTWLSRPPPPPQQQHPRSKHDVPNDARCPTCNQDLLLSSRWGGDDPNGGGADHHKNASSMVLGDRRVDVRKLKDAQPLAFRVLRRIRVSCPLREKHGCGWDGDYEDLTEHLLSDPAHNAPSSRPRPRPRSRSRRAVKRCSDGSSESGDGDVDVRGGGGGGSPPSRASLGGTRNGVADDDARPDGRRRMARRVSDGSILLNPLGRTGSRRRAQRSKSSVDFGVDRIHIIDPDDPAGSTTRPRCADHHPTDFSGNGSGSGNGRVGGGGGGGAIDLAAIQSIVGTAADEDDDEDDDAHRDNENPSSARRAVRRDSAESIKTEADAAFSAANYAEAVSLYGQALSVVASREKDANDVVRLNTGRGASDDGNGDDDHDDVVAALYANRAAAHLKLKDHASCVRDCRSCVSVDPFYAKAYYRMSRALIELGRFEEAVRVLEEAVERTTNLNNGHLLRRRRRRRGRGGGDDEDDDALPLLSSELRHARHVSSRFAAAERSLVETRDHAAAAAAFRDLARTTGAARVAVGAARSDLRSGAVDRASRTIASLSRSPTHRAEALALRGCCAYYAGEDLEGATRTLREATRSSHETTTTTSSDGGPSAAAVAESSLMRETKVHLQQCRAVSKSLQEARSAVFHRDYAEALASYDEAVDAATAAPVLPLPPRAPLYSALFAQRAEVHLLVKDFESAARDAATAVAAREDHAPAWIVRARALHGLGRHEQARNELRALVSGRRDPTTTTKEGAPSSSSSSSSWAASDERVLRALDDADFLVRRDQRPDYYAALGLPRTASEIDLKRRYKKLTAAEHHHDHDDDDHAQQKARLIHEGYEILRDEFRRKLYDEGYDAKAIAERAAAAAAAHHGNGHR